MNIDNEIVKIEETAGRIVNRLDNVMAIAGSANGIMASYAECRRVSAEVDVMRLQLEQQLNTLLLQAEYDLEKRKQNLPLLSRQLDKIQDRIDTVSNKLIDLMDDYSVEGMKKQEFLLDFIERQNRSFMEISLNLMK